MKPFKSTTMLRPLTDAELQLEDPQWEDDDIGNHPEVMAENTKIVIAVQSTQTDEQTLAQIQRMIDASMERLKDSMKLQVLQEQHGGQTAPTGPNQQDLDDMLDNLTIFDQ